MDSAPQENIGQPVSAASADSGRSAPCSPWGLAGSWNGASNGGRHEFCDVLGDGPEDLAYALRFDGPFLLQARDNRCSAHLATCWVSIDRCQGWEPACFLRPGRPVACDLGDGVRLPEAAAVPRDSRKPGTGNGQWLTRDGMNAVLCGKCPSERDVVSSACLWSTEPRIGLARDQKTRTAKEGMLYSTRHVRPSHGVSLGMCIAGLPADWKHPFGRLSPLGGESRLAECREWKAETALNALLDQIIDGREVVLVALSPLDLEEGIRPGKSFEKLGGARVVSACMGRPQRIGGWDSLVRRPLPIRSVLPPGSAVFCEIPDPGRFADAVAASGGGLVRIGARQEWGFGLVTLGVWPASQEESR